MNEDFKTIFDVYGVAKDGRVYNWKTGRMLKASKRLDGYHTINIKVKPSINKKFLLHRLVALVYLGDPGPNQVNHLDGNKSNNHIDNLEYTTQSGNIRHAKASGLMPKATYRKLTDDQVKDIKALLDIRKRCNSIYPKHKHIAVMFRVAPSMVDHIEKGKCWND